MKNKYRSILLLATMLVASLTLASCACTTPPGLVSLPDLPTILTVSPPDYRLLPLQKQTPITPPVASPGASKL